MLSCFFSLFLVMLSNFLIIPVFKEKIKVKLVFAIPTSVPTTLADEMIKTPLLLALEIIKIYVIKSIFNIFICNIFT